MSNSFGSLSRQWTVRVCRVWAPPERQPLRCSVPAFNASCSAATTRGFLSQP
ncbi:unnamed protein product [Ectocarpus sp. 6 AP-2014]